MSRIRKGSMPNSSLPGLLMAVEPGSAGGLGVVAVNDFHVVQANSGIEMVQRHDDMGVDLDIEIMRREIC